MRRSFLALLVCLPALLVGCAAGNIAPQFAFGDKPATGVVVVSVGHNASAGPGARANVYFDTSRRPGLNRLQSTGEAVTEGPAPTRFDDNSQLLVLSVPAGMHTLDAWQLRDSVGVWVQPAGVLQPLEFNVVAGEVKYLGNLSATLATRRNALGLQVVEGGEVEVKDLRERDVAAFERAYPQFKGQVVMGVLPVGRWAAPEGVEITQASSIAPPTLPGARR